MFEGAKGIVALVAGIGLLRFGYTHGDHATDAIVRHFHLFPNSANPGIFDRLIAHVTDSRLHFIAVAAILYSVIRFAETWGLWRGKGWAGWLALISGAIYLPFEVFEFAKTHRWEVGVLLLINVLIVLVVASRLFAPKTPPCDKVNNPAL